MMHVLRLALICALTWVWTAALFEPPSDAAKDNKPLELYGPVSTGRPPAAPAADAGPNSNSEEELEAARGDAEWRGTDAPKHVNVVTDPTGTPIFPSGSPMRTAASASSATDAEITIPPNATVTASPTQKTLTAGGALDSMLNALNVTMASEYRRVLPTAEPFFEKAVEQIVAMAQGRQMRYLPLEIEVSPGHLQDVYDTTELLQNVTAELTGNELDNWNIYSAWTKFLDNLMLPPRESDSIVRDRRELTLAWYYLYQAYYMAHVKNAKLAIAQLPHKRFSNRKSHGMVRKQWDMFSTTWFIQGTGLEGTDEDGVPGKRIKRMMKKCGLLTGWHYNSAVHTVLECSESTLR